MGTYNSGCAKIIVPILNQDPKGPMVMVSNANTNPGLTKAWDPGEPGKYYPTGKRNYYRVVTTDDKKHDKGKTNNRKSIDIVTGSLVFFPSSLLHYTIPFESNEDRIVLAFDVIPK